MSKSEFCFVYITAPNEAEAKNIATALVENRLAACVNLHPKMISIYKWKDKIHEDSEVGMIVKTKSSLVDEISKKVKQLHSFECPCILVLPITGGDESYLNCLRSSTIT